MPIRVGYDLAPEQITSAGVGRYARELRLALERRDDVDIARLAPHRPRSRVRARHRIAQGLLREILYYGGDLDRQARRVGAQIVHAPAYAPMCSSRPYVL